MFGAWAGKGRAMLGADSEESLDVETMRGRKRVLDWVVGWEWRAGLR